MKEDASIYEIGEKVRGNTLKALTPLIEKVNDLNLYVEYNNITHNQKKDENKTQNNVSNFFKKIRNIFGK